VKDNRGKLKQDLEDWFACGDSQAIAGMQMDFHAAMDNDFLLHLISQF